MHFPRDCSVGSVLESSCMTYTLRLSALASCFALLPASMQSSARFPCTYVQDVLYAGFAGRLYGCNRLITSGTSYLAKTSHEETTIFSGTPIL
jgi:hypothetical protein